MSRPASKEQAPPRETSLRVTVQLRVLDPDQAGDLRNRQLAAILRLLRRATASIKSPPPNSKAPEDHSEGALRQPGPVSGEDRSRYSDEL